MSASKGPIVVGGPHVTADGHRPNTVSAHFQTEAGTMMSSAGTSVLTETCGHVSPAKFSRTV